MIRPFCKEDTAIVADIAHRAWEPIFRGFREQIGEELMLLQERLSLPEHRLVSGKNDRL